MSDYQLDKIINFIDQITSMPLRLLHGSVLMEYHHKLMPFAWSLFIDASIFAAINSHRPYFFGGHVIGAVIIGVISVVTSFASFLKGIPPVGNPMRTHKLIGTLIYMLILIQVILGIISWLFRRSPKHSKWSIRLKKMHKFIGYSLAIIAKLQVLMILPASSILFWFNLIWNLITISLLIRSKRSKIKAQDNPQLKFTNTTYRLIRNLSEISDDHPSTFMYGNYVFQCQSMKARHPAGYQLILQSRNQCIDRYIYGMIGPQSQPSILLHTHTIKSLEMLSNPIAKIHVPEQYLNFSEENHHVQIYQVSPICPKNGVYLLKLKVLQNQMIQYQGYTSIEQLGRYYSLTFDHQATRLYSTVNFLLSQNVSFIQNVFPKLVMPDKGYTQLQQKMSMQEVQVDGQNIHAKDTKIPLIIKKYNNGRFTRKLFQSQSKSLILSCSKGKGLELNDISQGRIVLIAGGTGLLPFCDLIDLLFKQYLITRQPQYKEGLLNKNKILQTSFFDDNSFTIMIAVNLISEIHPIILQQLRYLSNNTEKYTIYIRTKEGIVSQEPNIKFQHSHFEFLAEEIIRNAQITKIIVCGSEKMNRSMTNLFNRLNFQKYLIL